MDNEQMHQIFTSDKYNAKRYLDYTSKYVLGLTQMPNMNLSGSYMSEFCELFLIQGHNYMPILDDNAIIKLELINNNYYVTYSDVRINITKIGLILNPNHLFLLPYGLLYNNKWFYYRKTAHHWIILEYTPENTTDKFNKVNNWADVKCDDNIIIEFRDYYEHHQIWDYERFIQLVKTYQYAKD
jgi:hypothetical protein